MLSSKNLLNHYGYLVKPKQNKTKLVFIFYVFCVIELLQA